MTTEAKTLRDKLRSLGILNGHTQEEAWEEVSLPLAMLQFDPSYQRDVRQGDVQKIVNDFDPLLWEPPDVNWREDGAFYCMDGQHRVRARLERDGEAAEGPCRLFYGLSVEQEALIFGAQDYRRSLTPLERWRGGLRRGGEPYTTINTIVEAAGWHVATGYVTSSHRDRPSGIVAVSALETIYSQYRDGHLYTTLTILRECFGTDFVPPNSMLLGVAQFLAWYEGDYDHSGFVRRVRSVGLSGVRDEADRRRILDRVSGREAIGMALVWVYNHNRKSDQRLDAWETKLRTRKGGGKIREER